MIQKKQVPRKVVIITLQVFLKQKPYVERDISTESSNGPTKIKNAETDTPPPYGRHNRYVLIFTDNRCIKNTSLRTLIQLEKFRKYLRRRILRFLGELRGTTISYYIFLVDSYAWLLTRADTLILPNSAIRAGMLSTRVPSLSGRVKLNSIEAVFDYPFLPVSIEL